MTARRLIVLVLLSLLAFAGNSILCRLALKQTTIDPASFTLLRLVSGAMVLWLATLRAGERQDGAGDWMSAGALAAYAAGFSFAYVSIPANTGALLLFGSVQATMIGHAIWSGERLHHVQTAGLLIAMGGLLSLFLPGLQHAPPIGGAFLMCVAGIAWGVYSLRGRRSGDPTRTNAGNFLRAALMALVLSLVLHDTAALDAAGVGYAIASGAVTSGLGYALWYAVLPSLKASTAATLQLSVPPLAAFGAVLFLDEAISMRLIVASVAILGGIGLVLWQRRRSQRT
ncbi:MAG: DMT family transporter [Pseudomonadota bacterium]